MKSPETYVGHQKAENFASPGGAAMNTRHLYAVPPRLRLNQWALSGEWTVKAEAAVLNAAGGRIAYRFHARDLHLIMGPAARRGSVPFRVFIDGQPPGAGHGSDVDDQGNGTVTEQRLYQLIRQTGPIADRQFEIEFLDPAWKRSRSRSGDRPKARCRRRMAWMFTASFDPPRKGPTCVYLLLRVGIEGGKTRGAIVQRLRPRVHLVWSRAFPCSGVKAAHHRLDRGHRLGRAVVAVRGRVHDDEAIQIVLAVGMDQVPIAFDEAERYC